MRNILKNFREYQDAHFVFSIIFLNRAFYDIMWENKLEPGKTRMTIRRIHFSGYVTKATKTYSWNM